MLQKSHSGDCVEQFEGYGIEGRQASVAAKELLDEMKE